MVIAPRRRWVICLRRAIRMIIHHFSRMLLQYWHYRNITSLSLQLTFRTSSITIICFLFCKRNFTLINPAWLSWLFDSRARYFFISFINFCIVWPDSLVFFSKFLFLFKLLFLFLPSSLINLLIKDGLHLSAFPLQLFLLQREKFLV